MPPIAEILERQMKAPMVQQMDIAEASAIGREGEMLADLMIDFIKDRADGEYITECLQFAYWKRARNLFLDREYLGCLSSLEDILDKFFDKDEIHNNDATAGSPASDFDEMNNELYPFMEPTLEVKSIWLKALTLEKLGRLEEAQEFALDTTSWLRKHYPSLPHLGQIEARLLGLAGRAADTLTCPDQAIEYYRQALESSAVDVPWILDRILGTSRLSPEDELEVMEKLTRQLKPHSALNEDIKQLLMILRDGKEVIFSALPTFYRSPCLLLARRLLARGCVIDSLTIAQRVLATFPLDWPFVRILIEALYLLGGDYNKTKGSVSLKDISRYLSKGYRDRPECHFASGLLHRQKGHASLQQAARSLDMAINLAATSSSPDSTLYLHRGYLDINAKLAKAIELSNERVSPIDIGEALKAKSDDGDHQNPIGHHRLCSLVIATAESRFPLCPFVRLMSLKWSFDSWAVLGWGLEVEGGPEGLSDDESGINPEFEEHRGDIEAASRRWGAALLRYEAALGCLSILADTADRQEELNDNKADPWKEGPLINRFRTQALAVQKVLSLPQQLQTRLLFKIAECQRQLGMYQDAANVLKKILPVCRRCLAASTTRQYKGDVQLDSTLWSETFDTIACLVGYPDVRVLKSTTSNYKRPTPASPLCNRVPSRVKENIKGDDNEKYQDRGNDVLRWAPPRQTILALTKLLVAVDAPTEVKEEWVASI